MKRPVLFCLHDDVEKLAPALRSFKGVERIACVSRQSRNGIPGDWHKAVAIYEAEGEEVFLGDLSSEAEHRQAGLNELKTEASSMSSFPTDRR